MNQTVFSLYSVVKGMQPEFVAQLSSIVFTPGLLPDVMKKAVEGHTPPMHSEELQHRISFDCPRKFSPSEAYVIEVGDYFTLRVDGPQTMSDSANPLHRWHVYVSLLGPGPLKKS